MCGILGLVTLLGLFGSNARADGLLYQLPEDRTWVRYELEITQERGGMQQTSQGSLTMASVGKATEGTEPCRWLEVKLQINQPGGDHTVVAKVLVPEKYLKKGENALDQMVRGWLRQKGDQDPVKLEASNFGPLRAFLAGPLQDEKKLDKEVVDTSVLGKLECEGVVGAISVTEGERMGKFTFNSRLHPKAPFGLVSSRLEFEFKRDGQVVETGIANFKLAEVGKDAESALPSFQ